ncbi:MULTISPECIES: class I SAM-dependent methyltransferase [Leptospira]|uniref:Methyltransferase n=1 Tax=Leptospira santarosai TaxID=28183 RepID=A0AB73ND44_9LEPT|nr:MULTISPECIES: class I SAM-dependent methyltransferase [Leptospira]EKO78327.1 methyltransferase domain protein [Leptospira sp. Fiocruz LV3954]EMI69117.1 methyltransferase domain protein [Leptospira sp. Fiocruz LV4135]EMO15181.1 methyltransferase domain protein [Leptospira santarosai str. CBC523]EMO34151.1 methyltransferase domain protein [Leptospira santarosai str. HAI821]EMO84853.1 methyltransferase domain protein [Leptospira santarosai str. AIM]
MFKKKDNIVWGRNYKGLPIRADYRVHDLCYNLIRERFVNFEKLKVLDIATGAGAFAQKLMDSFPSWSVDINDFEKQALIKANKRFSLDLNADFGRKIIKTKYDLVVAIEILEHLENPWHFLRNIRDLLKPNGLLVISTPNGDSLLDRVFYITEGHSLYFGESGYENSVGHITEVPDWLFRKIAHSSGFQKLQLFDSIDTEPLLGIRTRIKVWIIRILFGFSMKNKNSRSINVYLCN